MITGTITNGLGGEQTATAGLVSVYTDVANTGAAVTFTLTTNIVSAAGAVVATSKSNGNLDATAGYSRVSQAITLPGPVILWNLEVPYLYTVQSTLVASSGSTDAVNTTIGVRNAYFTANNGMILNGVPVQIKGVSQHQVREH